MGVARRFCLVTMLAAFSAPGHAASCPLPGEKVMQSAELFFGRTLPDGRTISDHDWLDFKNSTLSKYFRDGFTDIDATGQWRDPRSRAIVREKSRVVLVVATGDADFAHAIEAVSAAYRSKFHQQSVGIVTSEACAAF